MAVLLVVVAALLIGAGLVVGAFLALRSPPVATVDVEVGASEEGYSVWARNADGTPVRWDPCRPIEVTVSGSGGPATYPTDVFLADVEAAAATLRRATGLDLVVRGITDESPSAERSTVAGGGGGGTPRWAPVLVGWQTPDADLPLRDVDRGVAVPVAVGPAGGRVYVTGQVALNAEREDLLPGAADRATSWGSTVLHELAHVLGLGHVDDPDELMYVHPGRGPVRLGPGDLAGLRAVGAGGGCLEVPSPRELDVAVPEP